MPCDIDGKAKKYNCECPSCSKARERYLQYRIATRKKHSRKGCQCPKCIRYRESSRAWQQKARESLNGSHPNAYVRFRRKMNKECLIEALGGKCAVCGFVPIHRVQIDIHEENGQIANIGGPYDRTRMPSRFMESRDKFLILIEHIDELVPLCKNCHILLCSLVNDNLGQKLRIQKQISEWQGRIDWVEVKRKITETNLIPYRSPDRKNRLYPSHVKTRMPIMPDLGPTSSNSFQVSSQKEQTTSQSEETGYQRGRETMKPDG